MPSAKQPLAREPHLPSATEIQARHALDNLPDVVWAAPTRADLPDVAAMLEEVYAHEVASERQSLVDLQEYFDSPRSDPTQHDLIGRDHAGRVVALAQSRPNITNTRERRVLLFGSVLPSRRGQGLGRAIITWEIEHAKSWDSQTRQPAYGPFVLSMPTEGTATDQQDLAERFGLPAVRWYTAMSRPLTTPVEVPSLAGIELRPWDMERSEELRQVHNAAFADHWGSLPNDELRWHESTSGSHAFRPGWSLMAVDGDRIVGYAINEAWEQDWKAQGYRAGYTGALGVLRSHRGRGIAEALLLRSMQLFGADGMAAAELDVDTQNPSGAVGLYERLGYRPTHQTVLHRATL